LSVCHLLEVFEHDVGVFFVCFRHGAVSFFHLHVYGFVVMSCEAGVDFSEAFPRISGVVVKAFNFGEFAVEPFVSCVYFGFLVGFGVWWQR
jgi:hypothetical protein